MAKFRLSYDSPGPTCDAFMASNAFVRGIRGPIGSGKSTACCAEIVKRATMQKPGPDGKRRSRWAVIRNTYPELKTTTIRTWHGLVPPEVGRWVDQGPPTHYVEFGDVVLEVLFIALDSPGDVRKLLSLELTGAWINEAREVSKAVLDGLTGRVGRYPRMDVGGPTWFGVIMDTNPSDSDHWWYKLAEEDRPEDFAFFSQPSGLSPDAENRANLPAGYYERAQLGKSDDWIRVYVRGEYGFVQDGKPVYPEYSDSIHCAPLPLIPMPGQAFIGLDFGLTPAATFHQKDARGRITTFHELVAESMGATNFARLLSTEMARFPSCKWEIVGDPAGEQRAQTDEQTVFQVLIANGIHARKARTNDFTLRRDAVGNALSRLIDGRPGYLLSPTCTRLRKAMAGGYCFRRIQVANDRYKDVPDKDMNSRVAESAQYALIEMGENPRAMSQSRPPTGPIQARPDWNVFG